MKIFNFAAKPLCFSLCPKEAILNSFFNEREEFLKFSSEKRVILYRFFEILARFVGKKRRNWVHFTTQTLLGLISETFVWWRAVESLYILGCFLRYLYKSESVGLDTSTTVNFLAPISFLFLEKNC